MALVGAVLMASCSSADETSGQSSDSAASGQTETSTVDEIVVSDGALSDRSFEPVTVVVANSPGTLTVSGEQRLMTALLEPSGSGYLGSESDVVEVVVRPFEANSTMEQQRLASSWLSAHEANLGLYLSTPTFDAPGSWEVRIQLQGSDIGGTVVEVAAESMTPGPGSAAPASATPTAADVVNIFDITTDPEPNLDFYQLSIDEAIANGRPTVIAFATPIFCQTALCGPTIDQVKQATAGRQGVDVVHVEPFDLEQAKTGVLLPTEAMAEWSLPTEPWVFVVDESGTVTAAFEGIFGVDELNQALDAL